MNNDLAISRLDLQSALLTARDQALILFNAVEAENLLMPGLRESEINERIFELAETRLGVKKYWHKRIVRAGKNTLCPYHDNPADLILQPNDIVFLDLGPIFEDGVEADFARTYVLGNDPAHQQLLIDLQTVWNLGHEAYWANPAMTGRQLYQLITHLAVQHGYQLADVHCGHLLGVFPHQERQGERSLSYLSLENDQPMNAPAPNGETRFWVLEVQLIKPDAQWGGFVEDLLLPDIRL